MAVLVLDKHLNPLMPCSEKRARLLLERGRAVVHRRAPFTIRLKDRRVEDSVLQPMRVKLDPGSQTTGIALVRERKMVDTGTGEILRSATPRFDHRTKPRGWLAPSLQHRVDTTMAWVKRLMRWTPVTAVSQELVRFAMQQLQNPEIHGTEYRQGTLLGCEVRDYLLEKRGRRCAYCGAKNVPMEVEHLQPKAHGGSNRVSNLTLACVPYNRRKGAQSLAEFFTLIQRADGYGYSLTKIASEKGETGMGQAEPATLSLPGLKAEVSCAIG